MWLGNSPPIARKHDYQTTGSEFQEAVQPASADGGQETTQPQALLGVCPKAGRFGENGPQILVAGTGFEQVAFSLGNSEISRGGGAESGAVDVQAAASDAGLVEVLAAWPGLTAEDRVAVLVVVRRRVDS